MLHDRFFEFLQMGLEEDSSRRRYFLDRAQNILSQLMTSVNAGNSIGKSLFYLYDYAYVRLEKGSISDCKEVNNVMSPVRFALSSKLSDALSYMS